jgi:hypothetical protein
MQYRAASCLLDEESEFIPNAMGVNTRKVSNVLIQ